MTGKDEPYGQKDEFSKMLPNSCRSSLSLKLPPSYLYFDISNKKATPNLKQSSRHNLWNEDFSHRPSWCDASSALKQIHRKKAEGNTPALYLRAFLQRMLFSLGCFIQQHHREFIFLGLIILGAFCMGLQHTKIEISIDKLWVEKGGRLDKERAFVEQSFARSNDNQVPVVSQKVPSASGGGVTGAAQYLVLIQTLGKTRHSQNIENDYDDVGILSRDQLLMHAQVLSDVSRMSVDLYGEKWSLSDICFKPDPPTIEGEMALLFQNLVEKIVPCVMITPLDCFWEGSLSLGPFPPVEIPDVLTWFVPSLSKFVSWKVLDPLTVVNDLLKHIGLLEMEMLKSLFQRAGVEHGYLKRPCIDSLDPECPKTAPNYIDMCPIVADFLHWNNEEGGIYVLNSKFGAKANIDKQRRVATEATPTEMATPIQPTTPTRATNQNATTLLPMPNSSGIATNSQDFTNTAEVLDLFSVLDNNEVNGENLHANADDDVMENEDGDCALYRDEIRSILKSNNKLLAKFVPQFFEQKTRKFDKNDNNSKKDEKQTNLDKLMNIDPGKKRFDREMTGGCSGFAQKFMHWPEDLIIGGVHREGNRISRADALQTVLMINSPQEFYQRVKVGYKKHLNRYDWTLEAAENVLSAWQRNFTNFIYNHVNNSSPTSTSKMDSSNYRRLHPFTSTSINDIMSEFSKFNPTVILVGYALMLCYACASLMSCKGRGVKSSVGLAASGCFLVTLASLAGLGCSMIFGVPFNAATTQIVPFLALGLGVDDMFLLVFNYVSIVERVDQHEIGFLLKETGLAALLTSLNNVVAFVAGAILPIPALRDFCLQVALLLTFNAVAMLTIYPAMLSVDLLRRKRNRLDIFCCFRANDQTQLVESPSISSASSSPSNGVDQREDGPGLSTTGHQIFSAKKCSKSPNLSNVDFPSYKHSSDSGYCLSACCSCCRSKLAPHVRASPNCSSISQNGNSPGIKPQSSPLGPDLFAAPILSPKRDVGPLQNSEGISAGCCLAVPGSDWTLQTFVEKIYVKWITKTSVKVLVMLVNICLISLGVIGCNHITLGLELTDVLPKNTPPYAFLDARQAYFSFYPFTLVLKGPLDVAKHQRSLRQLRSAIIDVPYVVKAEEQVTSFGLARGSGSSASQFWLLLMSEWLSDLQAKFDQDFEAGLITRHGISPNTTVPPSPEGILAYKLLCNAGEDIRRSRVGNTRLVDKDGVVNPDGFYNYLTAWYNIDQMTYYVSQANFQPTPPEWSYDERFNNENMKVPAAPMPIYSQIPFFVNDLVDTPSIVDMITRVRAVCEEFATQGLQSFPEGIPFTFWEQYLHLRHNLTLALAVVIGAVFIVISLLLLSPWMAALVVFVLIVLVVELAGFMGVVGLKLNAVSGVSLITAVGIGVEFTVHVSLSFLTSLGSKNRRASLTLQHVAVPVLHGGLSTLLGVVMLAFSEFEFVVRYFFMVLSALVVLGLFNGLCVLPVLLSIIGPQSEVRTLDGSNHLAPPTPPPSPPPTPPQYHATNLTEELRMDAPSTGQSGGAAKGGYQRHSDSLSIIEEEQEPPPSATPSLVKVQGPKMVFQPNSTGAHMVNSPVNVTSNTKINVQLHMSDKLTDALVDRCTKLMSGRASKIGTAATATSAGGGGSGAAVDDGPSTSSARLHGAVSDIFGDAQRLLDDSGDVDSPAAKITPLTGDKKCLVSRKCTSSDYCDSSSDSEDIDDDLGRLRRS